MYSTNSKGKLPSILSTYHLGRWVLASGWQDFISWWGVGAHEHMIKNLSITLGIASETAYQKEALDHTWQTQGPWAESDPPPCFIQPGTLFLRCCCQVPCP